MNIVCLVAHLRPCGLVIEILLDEHLFGAMPQGVGHFNIHTDSAGPLEETIYALRSNVSRIGRGCEQAEDEIVSLRRCPVNDTDATEKVMQHEEAQTGFCREADPFVHPFFFVINDAVHAHDVAAMLAVKIAAPDKRKDSNAARGRDSHPCFSFTSAIQIALT